MRINKEQKEAGCCYHRSWTGMIILFWSDKGLTQATDVAIWPLTFRSIMGWPATLANSLGVAEEGLRLILGQISGLNFFFFLILWIFYVFFFLFKNASCKNVGWNWMIITMSIISLYRISFVSFSSFLFKKSSSSNSTCILCN